MNKLYPLATLLAATLLFQGAQAQTGGTYTAVRNGDWDPSIPSKNPWDPSGKPSPNCINCLIIINSGVSVNLNTSVELSGGSILQVGTDGSSAAVLMIGASGGVDFNTAYNIILDNDGTSNVLKDNDAGAFISATNAGTYDGVLSKFVHNTATSYIKLLGNSPGAFAETTVSSNIPASYGKTMTGPSTLNGGGTLPILLTNFEAVVNNGGVDLTWTTQMEQNSDHFDIERSANGGTKWDVVGSVAARGNSASPVNYSFTDGNPGDGTLQYRVHGYDLDGRPTLSPIKVIRTSPLATVSVFPNPAKDYVNVSLPVAESTAGTVSIRLIGQSGQLLAEKRVTGAGGTILSFPVSNYAPGNYLVQIVTADGTKQVSKVLIARQ